MFEEKSRVLSKYIESSKDNETKWLFHVEEKAKEIDSLVDEINIKEQTKENQISMIKDMKGKLDILKEEIAQLKRYKVTVLVLMFGIIILMIAAKIFKYKVQ